MTFKDYHKKILKENHHTLHSQNFICHMTPEFRLMNVTLSDKLNHRLVELTNGISLRVSLPTDTLGWWKLHVADADTIGIPNYHELKINNSRYASIFKPLCEIAYNALFTDPDIIEQLDDNRLDKPRMDSVTPEEKLYIVNEAEDALFLHEWMLSKYEEMVGTVMPEEPRKKIQANIDAAIDVINTVESLTKLRVDESYGEETDIHSPVNEYVVLLRDDFSILAVSGSIMPIDYLDLDIGISVLKDFRNNRRGTWELRVRPGGSGIPSFQEMSSNITKYSDMFKHYRKQSYIEVFTDDSMVDDISEAVSEIKGSTDIDDVSNGIDDLRVCGRTYEKYTGQSLPSMASEVIDQAIRDLQNRVKVLRNREYDDRIKNQPRSDDRDDV